MLSLRENGAPNPPAMARKIADKVLDG